MQFLNETKGKLTNFIRARVSNKADVEDILQETHLLAIRRFSTFRGESSVETWLFSIALNLIRNHYRKTRRSLETPIDWHTVEVLNVHDTHHCDPAFTLEVAELVDKFKHMSKENSEALGLVTLGSTYEEVAEVLDVPIGTIRSRVHRARKLIEEFDFRGATLN